MTLTEPQQLSDRELLERLEELVKRELVGLVEVLGHLAEVDARRLYLEQACPSMFAYCTQVLHFSEWAAYHRIAAARVARRFPVVLDKVRAGELHLSGLTVLAPHLTPENHLELLAAARHKSKRGVEALVAELCPKPDVSTVVRPVPAAKPPESPTAPARNAENTSQFPPPRLRTRWGLLYLRQSSGSAMRSPRIPGVPSHRPVGPGSRARS